MEFLVKIFTFLIVMTLPLYLWAYSLTLADQGLSSRFRLYSGIISGIFSVGIVWVLTYFMGEVDFLGFFLIFLAVMLGIYGIIFIFFRFFRQIGGVFVQKISGWHIMLFILVFSFIFLLSYRVFGNFGVGAILIMLFMSAFFEEISKHFSSLLLLSSRFRFSRQDIMIFAFCSAVGFTFVENFLYFFQANISIFSLLGRSIFSFSAHLLSALIIMLFWWKSLSYRIFGVKYFLYFLIGFLLAVSLHMIFNFALQHNFVSIGVIYCIAAYGLFVYFLQKE